MTELWVMCIVGRIPPVHNVHKLCEPEHDFDQQECNFEGPPCVLKNYLIIRPTITLHKALFTDADDSLSPVTTAPMIPRHPDTSTMPDLCPPHARHTLTFSREGNIPEHSKKNSSEGKVQVRVRF